MIFLCVVLVIVFKTPLFMTYETFPLPLVAALACAVRVRKLRMRNLLGWLETRLAQNTLNELRLCV